MAAELEVSFRGSVKHVRTLTKKPSNDELLELYSLYKQSTVGTCNTAVPGRFDVVNRAKWNAWNALSGTSKADAMRRYIALVGRLHGDCEQPKATPDDPPTPPPSEGTSDKIPSPAAEESAAIPPHTSKGASNEHPPPTDEGAQANEAASQLSPAEQYVYDQQLIEERFTYAVACVSAGRAVRLEQQHSGGSGKPPPGTVIVPPSSSHWLELYGLLKQATEGDVNTPAPSLLDFSQASRKWYAWDAVRKLPKPVARERYISVLEREHPGWDAGFVPSPPPAPSPPSSSDGDTKTQKTGTTKHGDDGGEGDGSATEPRKKQEQQWNKQQRDENESKTVVAGIKLAPLNVPLKRRRQTAAIALWWSLPILSPTLTLLLLRYAPLLILAYLTWVFLIDAKTTREGGGGRRSPWLRSHALFRHMADYFPATLEVEEPLDPKHTYVCGYHPHGIFSVGALLNFGTEATGLSVKLPGIQLTLLTLVCNLRIPFIRDILLGLGMADASKESCDYVLKKGAGHGIVLVVGGAAEALDSHPGVYDLTLAQRKGFVRVALRHGSHLVPMFGFGEPDLYEQIPNPSGSLLRRVQNKLRGLLGVGFPLLHGRGVYTYNLGVLPRRRPLHVVTGPPIPVGRVEHPSASEVDEVHAKYLKALRDLFDRHKARFLPPGASLRMVDGAGGGGGVVVDGGGGGPGGGGEE